MKRYRFLLLVAGILIQMGSLSPSFAIDCSLFAPHQTLNVGTQPVSPSAGDLDGDLDIDVVLANEGSATVSVIKNNGSNVFVISSTVGVGSTPTGTALGDFDGDGDLDCAVTNHGSGSVSLLTNDGSGSFSVSTITAGGNPYSPVVCDLDNDSLPDLLVVNRSSGSVGVYFNTGAGLSTSMTSYPVAVGVIGAEVGDFDSDGWLDVAVANYVTGELSILRNVSGSLSHLVTYTTPAGSASIAVADFDADSIPDLAVTNNGADNVTIHKGNGDCTFAYLDTLAAGNEVGSAQAGDIDRDGDFDLVCADFTADSRIWTNVGNSLVEPSSVCGFGMSLGILLVDWDRDGDLDIAAASYNDGQVTFRRNMTPRVLLVPSQYPTIQAGIDAATDGDTVLVASGSYADHLNFQGKDIVVRTQYGPDSTSLSPAVAGLALVQFVQSESSASVIEGFTFEQVVGAEVVRIVNASPRIQYNVFVDNVSPSWTSIIVVSGSNTQIIGNTFKRNRCPSGKGVVIASASGVILDSNEFYHNYVGDGGGAIVVYGSGCRVRYNIIYADTNTDDWGGQIYAESPQDLVIDHNTIVGNWSPGNGCGITLLNPNSCTITNNLLSYNRSGFAIYAFNAINTTADYNCLWDNPGGSYFGVLPGPGSMVAGPLLCDTASLNLGLSDASPLIGAGSGGSTIGAVGVGCILPAPEQPVVTHISTSPPDEMLHVIDHTPDFIWGYLDPQSRPHTESEIEVGSNTDWTTAEMWQPPTIIGPYTSIEYAGLPLTDGATYYVRVRVFNDTLWSNWLVAPFRMNSVPTAPAPISPADLSIVLTGRPTLGVSNATDAENDTRRCDFEVYRNVGLTQLAAYIAGKVEGVGQTSWKTDSLTFENSMHWWRARANDGYENGPWSQVYAFTVDAYNEPPSSVILISLEDSSATSDLTPAFIWNLPSDPDPNPTRTYKLILALDPGFTFRSEVSGLTDTTYQWPTNLVLNQSYWWKVEVNDGRGGISTSPVRTFTTVTPCACDCHADPVCDGVKSDVVDVVTVIGIAFRGATPVIDPNTACPRLPTDMNCSGATDVVDVVKTVNVAFRGANPATEYCVACESAVRLTRRAGQGDGSNQR